ncbi:unnamed protein product, partial [Meganyctiphanes norvegica]
VVTMLQWCRIILAGCALFGVALAKPQTPDGVADEDNGIPLSCECLEQIQSDLLPGVLTATKDLSNVVDELFTATNQAELSPVTDRHFCLFCGRIRRVYGHVNHGWHHNYRRWTPCRYSSCYNCYHHCPSCCRSHRWRRQVQEGAAPPACPLEDVRQTENTVKESAKVVREVLAGIKTDPKEITQDLLDDITQLYNEVNSSVKNLKGATSTINKECSSNGSSNQADGAGVLFPDEV